MNNKNFYASLSFMVAYCTTGKRAKSRECIAGSKSNTFRGNTHTFHMIWKDLVQICLAECMIPGSIEYTTPRIWLIFPYHRN